MTEAEWLACEEPEQFEALLRNSMSERKLRLLAAACIRRHAARPMLVEVATAVEDYADGRTAEDVLAVAHDFWRQIESYDGSRKFGSAATYRDAA